LHIAKLEQWEQTESIRVYKSDTLNSDGFIHCSTPQQVVKVANAVYHGQRRLVLLVIKPSKVQSEIRFEKSEGEELYPHIYGPLNVDAVIKVHSFEPNQDGNFKLPAELESPREKNL
jgi:uncharacterized protein (DUF952 family)